MLLYTEPISPKRCYKVNLEEIVNQRHPLTTTLQKIARFFITSGCFTNVSQYSEPIPP